jgi:hypothetical protein
MSRIAEYPHSAYIRSKHLNVSDFPKSMQKTIERFTNLYNKTVHEKGQQIAELADLSNEIVSEIKEWQYGTESESEASEANTAITGKDKKDKILADFWNEGVKYLSLAELKAAGYPISLGSPTPKTAQFKLSYTKDKTSKRFGMYQISKIK